MAGKQRRGRGQGGGRKRDRWKGTKGTCSAKLWWNTPDLKLSKVGHHGKNKSCPQLQRLDVLLQVWPCLWQFGKDISWVAGPLTELTVALRFGLDHLRSVEEAALQPEPMMSWVLRLDSAESTWEELDQGIQSPVHLLVWALFLDCAKNSIKFFSSTQILVLKALAV